MAGMKRGRGSEVTLDGLPVELIGYILSRLEAARDVTVASVTCQKWREAACRHLHSLRFYHADWDGYKRMSADALEVIITRTVLRTTSLRRLSIRFRILEVAFTPAPLVAWLLHTRDTLRFLCYHVETSLDIEVLETCGRQMLEGLVFGKVTVSRTGPRGFQTFPALSTLTLSHVKISVVDLNLLLSACPKLKALVVSNIDAAQSQDFELRSDSLRSFHLSGFSTGGVIVFNFDNLRVLSLKDSSFKSLDVLS